MGQAVSVREDDFFVRFWGVRGSIACSGPDTARYGGNTSCLEMRCGGRLLIFDAGTGIRYLGNTLVGEDALQANLFLTHTHFDHICGLPFFRPIFDQGGKFHIWAGHLLPDLSVHKVLDEMMMAPLFPVPLGHLKAELNFIDFRAGETLEPWPGVPELKVRTAPLNHPNGATGYRIDYGAKSICYITDTEHRAGAPDRNILDLIEGSDITIYDCMYTDEEFSGHIGWGHSSWEEGLRLCDAAGVKQFVVFHHDPDHDDAFLDAIAEKLAGLRPGSVVAHEGLVLRP